ncbi:MAG: hypothetical protein LBE62_11695, partial [Azonexus sp.]|nr:hypothetical protein [Azonexus sp.]
SAVSSQQSAVSSQQSAVSSQQSAVSSQQSAVSSQQSAVSIGYGSSKKFRAILEKTAQAILDARALYPESTLADLYDPLTMPPELRKAHATNDRAVDAAYNYKGEKTDAARVAFLFDLYGKLTSLLPAEKTKRGRKA